MRKLDVNSDLIRAAHDFERQAARVTDERAGRSTDAHGRRIVLRMAAAHLRMAHALLDVTSFPRRRGR